MNNVFLAEDSENIASTLIRYMSKYEFQITHRSNGKEAYGYLIRYGSKYDLAIFDIKMPGLNGVDLCYKLRRQKVQLPILMLTNTNDSDTIVKALNTGADDYLTKPFALPELLARCRALTRRPPYFESRLMNIKDLRIDLDAFTVHYKGKKINLRKKEFELLHYLVRNRNQLITREQILANVWSYMVNPYPNTVDVHIATIRAKLIEVSPDAKKLIQTVHGQGYRINTFSLD